MKAFLFGLGVAAGLVAIPILACELIERLLHDDYDIMEDDGFVTVYPELRR